MRDSARDNSARTASRDLSGDIYRVLIEPGSPPLTDAENIAGFWGSLGELITFSHLVAAALVQASRGAAQASDGLRAAVPFIPAVHDKLTRGRIHRASIWIPLLIIVWYVVLNAVVARSELAFKAGSWLLE